MRFSRLLLLLLATLLLPTTVGCSDDPEEPAPTLTDVTADVTDNPDEGPDEADAEEDAFVPPFPGCGDGVCMGEESASNCCVDCKCGQGFQCENNKCKVAPSCGDGICQPGQAENCDSCALDCACANDEVCTETGACCLPECKDKICGTNGCGGSCGACADGSVCDGGQCVAPAVCGDGYCDTDLAENCSSCSDDCTCEVGTICQADGSCCQPSCGGKHCGTDGCGGTCGVCQVDALCVDNLCIAQFGCGNLKCEPEEDENCATCPSDCKCVGAELCTEELGCCEPSCDGKECGSDGCVGGCGQCPPQQGCQEHKCVDTVYCGNGTCDPGTEEHCGTCAADCGCGQGFVCVGTVCCQPACDGKECGTDGCGGSCGECQGSETCGPGGQCLDAAAFPQMVFDPEKPTAGKVLTISALDTSPWAYVAMAAEGPCGAVATKWKGVDQVQPGVWQWQYEAGPLGGGQHTFTFTRDSGATVVVTDKVNVSGLAECGDQACPYVGAACEETYTEEQTCAETGKTETVQCVKKGACSGVGDATNCSWGPASYCDDPCDGAEPPATSNRFGIGLVSPGNATQWDLAKELAGDGGFVLLLFPGVKKGAAGPKQAWKDAVQAAYARNLIPVVRLGPPWGEMQIRNDSDDFQHKKYTQLAKAYRNVVKGLPLKDGVPLYIQVHNEPNLCAEWACSGGGTLDAATRAAEYAGFYRDVADALHAMNKTQIKVSMGALAPGGVKSCSCCGDGQCEFQPGATGLDYMAQMKAAVPDIWSRLDFLASHSYPAEGTGWGFFVPYAKAKPGLTYFEQELDAVGQPDLPVIVTETGWPRSLEGFGSVSFDDQAAWTKQAFKDIFNKHPNVLGVTPFVLQDATWGDANGFGWVHTDGTKHKVFNTLKSYRCALGLGPC